MSFSSAPGAALSAGGGEGGAAKGGGGGRQAGGGSGEARFRPPRSAGPLGRAEKPQYLKLAERGGSGGGVYRPHRTPIAGSTRPKVTPLRCTLGSFPAGNGESLLKDKMVQAGEHPSEMEVARESTRKVLKYPGVCPCPK